MEEFITFSFDDIKLIMRLENSDAFYPVDAKNQQITMELPSYVDGMFDVMDTPNLIVNLHSLLDFSNDFHSTNQILYKINNDKLDYSLRISFPYIMEFDMDTIKDEWLKISNIHSTFPFLSYVDINNEIYMYIDRDELSAYLANDISDNLQNNWKSHDFSWIEKIENIHRLEAVRSVPQGSPSVIKSSKTKENLFIVRISGFSFAFEESIIEEIIVNQESSTSLTGAAYWVNGIMDYRGNSIPNIDLPRLFNLETEKETEAKLTIIIRGEDKFAINVESIKFVDTAIIQDFGSKLENKNIPFSNVFMYEDEYVLKLNFKPIYNSIYKDIIENDWSSWTQWLATFKFKNGKQEISNQVIAEYLGLKFGSIDVLLHLEDNYTFYNIDQVITPVDNFPHYCQGLVELAGKVCIYIDLHKMLELPALDDNEEVILQVSNDNGDFAFLIPKPTSITRDPIPAIKITKSSRVLDVPINSYYIVDTEPYVYLNPTHLTNFISAEMSVHLDAQWTIRRSAFEEILQNQEFVPYQSKVSYAPTRFKQFEAAKTSGRKVQAYYTFSINEIEFILNAENIIEFDIIDSRITNIPHASSWMSGVLDFKNEHLPVIDLAQWLGVEKQSNRFFVVINYENEHIAILIPSMPVYTDGHNLVSVAEITENVESVPIDLIYTENERVLYQLNYSALSKSILENKLITISGKTWTSLLNFRFERPELAAMIDLRNYLLITQISDTIIGFEMTNVVEIVAFESSNHHFENDQVFSKYRKEWIPSIYLDRLFSGEYKQTNPVYSVVFETQGNRYEIPMDRITLKEKGSVEEKAESWNFRNNNIIWKDAKVYKYPDSVVLKLEPSQLYEEIISQIDANLLNSLQEQATDEVVEEITDYYTDYISLCDPKYKVYLLMPTENDVEEGNNSIALPIEDVEEVRIDVPKDGELIPWDRKSEESEFIYVKIHNGNGGIFHQIPSSCKLMAFDQSKIIQENGSIFIDSKQEKIPVKKSLVKEVKK